MGINAVIRRHSESEGEHTDKGVNLAGTSDATLVRVVTSPSDGEADLGIANGMEGNDHKYPDEDYFLINPANGKRYQDFATSHLSEGEAPGRIPHRWNNLIKGVLGKHVTGEQGDTGVWVANDKSGGAEDQAYIQHIGIPRGSTVARAYSRTVDDAALIPAIFISDPTRR